jgi:hypothetical protein
MSMSLHFLKSFMTKLSRLVPAVILSLLLASTTLSVSVASTFSLPVSAAPGQRDNQALPSNIENALNQSVNENQSSANSSGSAAFYNWTGYASTSSQPFLEVTTTYTQPSISCPSSGPWSLFWTGFDGFNDSTVEQAGTSAQCINTNQPDYYAWWEMYPTNQIQVMPITIIAGNTIKDTVTYIPASGLYTLTVQDQTNKQHYTESTSCASGLTCSRQSAEWIAERTSTVNGYALLAQWNKMAFTASEAANTVSAKGVNQMEPISSFSNTDITMVGYPNSGSMLANSGSLSSNGKKFSSTWDSAQ